MDLIVRQATEGGVQNIIPFQSDFSVVKKSEINLARYEKIIKEARQQSGSRVETRINKPLSFSEMLNFHKELKNLYKKSADIVMYECADFDAGAAPDSFHKCITENTDALFIIVGAEGGFSKTEAQKFRVAGFTMLSLGETILRTETAAAWAVGISRLLKKESALWSLN
jgi:16S rRNA (uracil1498-N3)-methyltransferase